MYSDIYRRVVFVIVIETNAVSEMIYRVGMTKETFCVFALYVLFSTRHRREEKHCPLVYLLFFVVFLAVFF